MIASKVVIFLSRIFGFGRRSIGLCSLVISGWFFLESA